MDVENADNSSSLVNLTHKPPTRARKKKSAVAKLAEKRRGSQASLPREESNPNESGKPKEETLQQSENLTHNGDDSSNKQTEEVEINVEADKHLDGSPPKPAPRRTSRRKPLENNSEGFEGGTFVSIYEKRDHSSKESKSKESEKPKLKKELFPGNSIHYRNDDIFSSLGPVKARPGLSSVDDLPPLDRGLSKNVKDEDSLPEPMDIDDDSDENDKNDKKDDIISKNVPSDATVHRFRAMRMTPDRSRSEESLKNATFSPKPPSTPRSARKITPPKGEKRNREANSSGEEPDVETKKQNSSESANISSSIVNTSVSNLQPVSVDNPDSVKVSDNILNSSLSNLTAMEGVHMDVDPVGREPVKKGLSIHPNVKEVKDYTEEYNVNQNMNTGSPKIEEQNEGISVSKTGSANEVSEEVSSDNVHQDGSDSNLSDSKQNERKSGKKKIIRKPRVKPNDKRQLISLDSSDLVEAGSSSNLNVSSKSSDETLDVDRVTNETLGSASDLQAVSEKYREVLKDSSPVKVSQGSLRLESVIPEPDPSSGKLAPIQPKHLPPPLPHDMKSTSLRTTYKTDPAYNMNKFFGRSFSSQSDKEKTKTELLSHRSLSGGFTTLHAVPTREARDRMKQGTLGASLVSSAELDRYFPDRKVGLWVGSWNMAEIKECQESLDDFLLPEVSEYVQDIYAIGTQENDMNKKEWEILLQETIGPSHVLFHSASHGALHLAVFVKRDLIWFCTIPEDSFVQTRAFTMVKTKGAIAIGFQFFGTSFIFINCHFAPGDARNKDRLGDFRKIVKDLNLPKQVSVGSPGGSNTDVTTRYDSVFWMGDLNFRIEVYKGKQAVEDIVKYIEEQEHKNFEDLLSRDQLSKLIVEGSIFQGFQEGRINFRPTYKYDKGHNTFDTSSKNRIPSYTDRILFRARKKNSIVCTHYDSPSSVRLSDHHPVYAIFDVAIQPVRECSVALAAGQFNREVYTEANRRRSLKIEVISTMQKEKSSKVCSIQ